jgi:hypothetical protein
MLYYESTLCYYHHLPTEYRCAIVFEMCWLVRQGRGPKELCFDSHPFDSTVFFCHLQECTER